MQESRRITIEPAIMGGKPCIRGMRVTVGMIVESIAAGRTIPELLADFPYLEEQDIREALSYCGQPGARTRDSLGQLMRLLVDMNLTPRWVEFLVSAGYESVHWSSLGAAAAPDVDIFCVCQRARLRDRDQ